MTWGSIAGAAAGVVGGLLQSDSSKSAIDAQSQGAAQANAAQAAAAERADATQRYMYDTTRADNSPFLRNGTAASNRLSQLLGIGGTGRIGAFTPKTEAQLRSEMVGQYTKPGQMMPGDDGGFGGQLLYYNNPTHAEDQTLDQQLGRAYVYSPKTQGGAMSAPTIDESGLNSAVQKAYSAQGAATDGQIDPEYGSMNRQFNQGDLNNDLVYQNGLKFGLDQGRQGIENQASASGSMLSGATLKALTRFGNDYGTTKTEGAYNRYEGNKTNTYNRLAGVAGSGQTASSQIGGAGQNYANQVGGNAIGLGNSYANNAIGLGNARGASTIYGGNALANGLNGAASAFKNWGGGGRGGGYNNGGTVNTTVFNPYQYPGAEY